ncbi:MAG TPA: [FeFe] hydrogenase, group A, partial [Victivallales bacterium]|nr:[FeFe] hydrogenase, group A [Victivallales bacterium]
PVTATKAGLDITSPSIIRDPAKCILCGKCVRMCEEIQGISSIDFVRRGSKMQICPAFEESLNVSSCINCGQCITVCPTGALREKSYLQEVHDALQNPELIVVAQHAPAVSVSIAEEFGLKPGTDVNGILTAALREIGFKYVFETSFSADLTIMEEASELVHRIKNGGVLPMMTSCSPGWIKYIEQFYPEFLPNLSTCKSPQQMLGALIKSYFANVINVKPEKIYSVSLMPCTAKKFEASRPEMATKRNIFDIDAVLTTRELARLLKLCGINMNALEPSDADNPFGRRSSAGKIFGASGGVMEAAIRTAHYLITGKDLTSPKIEFARGLEGIKEGKIKIEGIELGFAVVNGIGNAPKILNQIKNGRNDIHFIEVMTCPGGCVGGGGQPIDSDQSKLKARLAALYSIDNNSELRFSHRNPDIIEIYGKFLEKPLSEKSHELLHTHYKKRKVNI